MKKSLQGLAEWSDLHASISLTDCPDCGGYLDDLKAIGFWLSVCKKCQKFWSLKILDVSDELSAKFKKENL